MDAQAARATVAIVVLALLSVGAGWMYNAVLGPPAPANAPAPGDEILTLVGFPEHSFDLATETLTFTGTGVLDFEPISLPFENITKVSVTLRVTMRGPSAGDTYDVVITDPIGQTVNGQETNQASPNGYEISRPLIQEWQRGELPSNQHYATSDEDTALNWAAENWTDSASSGPWNAQITLNPPVTPIRQGNASLLFRFSYYEAIAFPPSLDDTSTPAPTSGQFKSVDEPNPDWVWFTGRDFMASPEHS